MFNNYDMNSKGLSITGYCSYDTFLSQNYFEENFERVKGYGTRYDGNADAWFLSEYGTFDSSCLDEYKIEYTNTKDALAFIERELGYYTQGEFESDAEYIESIIEELIAHEGFKGGVDCLKNSPISLEYKDDIRTFSTRGYCQGDYEEVLVNMSAMAKVMQCDIEAVKVNDIQTQIDRLFWDCPLSCRVEINDKEFYYELDTYEWHKEEFIQDILKEYKEHKDVAYIKETLERLLPDTPSYD